MNSTVMIYYTFEGNTGYVAEVMREALHVETERLNVEKEPPKKGFGKFFWGGKSAIFQEDIKLSPLKTRMEAYSNIIIAFPVWAGTYPPAIGSFLREYPLRDKNIFIIVCSASGKAEKAVEKIKRKLSGDNRVIAYLSLVSPLKNQERTAKQIQEFARSVKTV